VETEYETCSNNEWQEVSRSHSTKMVANIMLKALGCEHWRAKEHACSRKGYWRMAQVLNQIFSNKIIAKLGYTSMLDYYPIVYEN